MISDNAGISLVKSTFKRMPLTDSWITSVWFIFVLVAAIYVALGGLLFFSQSRLLYYPIRHVAVTPDSIGLSYEPIEIRAKDGVRLDAWFLPAPQRRGVLLFFHGNAGNISHRLDSLKIFHDLGLTVLIFDYRGYGRSEGTISEQGIYRDAEAVWRYLAEERGFSNQEIVFFGRSLGAAVAAWLAARHKPAALIMESAFTSVPDLAQSFYPIFPARWMVRSRYSADEYLRTVTCPILVIHSRDDEIIPIKHGRRVFVAASEPKQFLEIRGGHNDGFLLSGRLYVDGLDAFLRTHLEK